MNSDDSQLPEETIRTLMDFFKNLPISRLIEIKHEEQGNVRNDVCEKERTAHFKDGEYLPYMGEGSMQSKLYVKRKESRLKQKDVAEMLKIHPVTYHKKESGKNEFELLEAKMLAKYFNVTLDDLFGD
ncbi:helix-turn-helix transcriptional regulator [Sporosarcina sp. FA9]|uniref:helix-turn-helix transcriptional regulator n=1 Tax=Sporosarcina sp. FA9 TaxID=3413030 RepID=UPI003F656B91